MAFTDPRTPTRAELSVTFKDNPRMIRAFETLFDLVPSELNTILALIEETTIAAGSAAAKSQQANDAINRLAAALEMLSMAPSVEVLAEEQINPFIPHTPKFIQRDVVEIFEPVNGPPLVPDDLIPSRVPDQLVDSSMVVNGNLTLPKRSSCGLQVDKVNPTFGWRDLLGEVNPRNTGAGRPALSVFRGGNIRDFAFSAGDDIDFSFHIPHDYVLGTDIYFHVHWAHNGTAIAGNIVWDFFTTYAKGHNQADFPAEKNLTLTYATVDIATTPQYRHRIEELVISTSGGSATLLDSDTLEPDGVIMMHLNQTTIPTITGGTPNEPFLLFVDIHYQSTSMATKQKEPDFYT